MILYATHYVSSNPTCSIRKRLNNPEWSLPRNVVSKLDKFPDLKIPKSAALSHELRKL